MCLLWEVGFGLSLCLILILSYDLSLLSMMFLKGGGYYC